MTMTPFEVRQNLLDRAYDYLIQKYHAELAQADLLKDTDTIKNLKFPTTDEILALANIYKNFVDKK